MGKSMVSCRFSLKPIHWLKRNRKFKNIDINDIRGSNLRARKPSSFGYDPRKRRERDWKLLQGVFAAWTFGSHLAVCQNLVPLVNIKIAGKWMFIPLKMVLIGIDPYPFWGSVPFWDPQNDFGSSKLGQTLRSWYFKYQIQWQMKDPEVYLPRDQIEWIIFAYICHWITQIAIFWSNPCWCSWGRDWEISFIYSK